MKRSIVTPATLPVAALAELKDWLGVTTMQDDRQLSALLRGALEVCEQFTGLMPLQQTCEEIWPITAGWQTLQSRPVLAITQLEGIPAEGSRFTLAAEAYAIDLDADGGGRFRVISPGIAGQVAVRFAAGLAPNWTALPESLRHGMLRLAAFQYRTRDDESLAQALPPAAVAVLWRPWRRLRLA